MKDFGAEEAFGAMAPAQQRLETCKLGVRQAGDRLKNHLDLAALNGFAQVVLEAQEGRTLTAHVLAEKFYGIPPRRLAS